MKKCLCPGRLPYLGHHSSPLHHPAISARRLLRPSLCRGIPSWRTSPGRRQWSRQFSAGSPALADRLSLRRYFRGELSNCPVVGSRQKDPNAWIPLLEKHLPPSLRNNPEDAVAVEPESDTLGEKHAQGYELATLLYQARNSANLDLLAHLGFRLNRWPAVHALFSQLLDAAEALHKESVSVRPPSSLDWGLKSGISLDALTRAPTEPGAVEVTRNSQSLCFDELTERPFAGDLALRFMAEVWQSLGSIVLEASELSPNESKLAMSYVFQLLARLHHSGAISDKVYQYAPPDSVEAPFRPPGMHLLSIHIMSVLSDAAWLVHEAEVAAKAAAAGEESPYVPLKMGVRELGPEIWLELILWCCIEHGHVREGLWLLERMKERTGDLTWNFQSWRPLLKHPELVRKTNIDLEEVWRRPDHATTDTSPKKRNSPSPFHGLGKRMISVEVAASLRDSLVNLVYLGLGFRGLSPTALLQHVSRLDSLMAPTSVNNEKFQPTTKASNSFTARVIQSGGLDPEVDPQAFERLLRFHPHVVPPWDADLPIVQEDLEQTTPIQLYHETSALAGLIEYNIRFYSSQRQSGAAFDTLAWLQEVVDSSKLQRINQFFQHLNSSHKDDQPSFDFRESVSSRFFESSLPQLSSVTFAELLDLATASRAFPFGEWLLFSNDVDGPPIHPDSYGNQALAPSILRFAVATKNTPLCNRVIASLSQPLSSNTLRALLNFRIVMGDWDRVVMMLNYLRDYRLKSWSHSNVTTLAGAILRMDRALQRESDPANVERREKSLAQAKDILLRIFNGEFSELSSRMSGNKFQQHALLGLHRIFMSIPGPLRDLAQQVNLTYKPTTSHNAVPYIPTISFHNLLSAVVDVHGSAAGKKMWQRWCLDPMSPAGRRLHEGGVSRLYLFKERDPKRGDPHFDAAWFKQLRKRATIPNLNTVRIIAQTAVKEYNQDQARKLTDPKSKVLTFCVQQFKTLRLPDEEIERETQGHLSRMKTEGLLNRRLWKKGIVA
ncbi:hypothetical protein ASPWEDRAFT_103693 [Aspergillus wentii DTO 134E9]|uniref:Uncharacterized protein n=1 Tax=Aspergillus wentii DTO 134E9 TaxID=1073089 RepID=A0A1L9RW43_ASPWE|nr:uncharacterized protein ASPWEDRAFT_103693 [Aspergillus wentii DTO 134E9]OJJ39146.1 hypothetical protein ASPWEDRAFT_103693 [Aspergillus wentii DTO 134E9]